MANRPQRPARETPGRDPLDERLHRTLLGLPRVEPSPRFTADVLDRMAEPEVSGSSSPWGALRWFIRPLPALATTAALLLLVVVGGRELEHRHQRQLAIERIATLKAEQQALEAELEALKRLATQARPVLYLGSDRDVDLVFDLTQLRQGQDIVIPDHVKYNVWPELRTQDARDTTHPWISAVGAAMTNRVQPSIQRTAY